MKHTLRVRRSCDQGAFCKILFLVLWFLGLVLGLIFAVISEDAIISLMRGAAFPPVSIVGLISVFAFPFLISACAVYFDKFWLLFPAGFLKAFSFGVCAASFLLVYGRADWIVRCLLMFFDLAMTPFFLWFCLRRVRGNRNRAGADLLLLLVFGISVGFLDYCFISPILVMG